MAIKCQLFILFKIIDGCVGDFVDNTNSHKNSEHIAVYLTDDLEGAKAIVTMFDRDCDLYSSDCGIELDSFSNGITFIVKVGVNECHLPNLVRLRDLVNVDNTINKEKIANARDFLVSRSKN